MVGQHQQHHAHARGMQDGKVSPCEAIVEKILRAGNVEVQAAVLRAVASHPSLAPARELARIDSSKEQAGYKFVCVCEQSVRLMKKDCFTQ